MSPSGAVGTAAREAPGKGMPPPPPEVWLEPRFTRECPGRAPGPRRRSRGSLPLRNRGQWERDAAEGRAAPVTQWACGECAGAALGAARGGGRKARGPLRAAPLPAHVFGTGSRRSPPAAQECACAAFVSAGAHGHLPERGAAREPCWARRAWGLCTADCQNCIFERDSVKTLEPGDP